MFAKSIPCSRCSVGERLRTLSRAPGSASLCGATRTTLRNSRACSAPPAHAPASARQPSSLSDTRTGCAQRTLSHQPLHRKSAYATCRLTRDSSCQSAVRWRGPEGPQVSQNLRGVTLVASSTFAERPHSMSRDHRAALPLGRGGGLQLSHGPVRRTSPDQRKALRCALDSLLRPRS